MREPSHTKGRTEADLPDFAFAEGCRALKSRDVSYGPPRCGNYSAKCRAGHCPLSTGLLYVRTAPDLGLQSRPRSRETLGSNVALCEDSPCIGGAPCLYSVSGLGAIVAQPRLPFFPSHPIHPCHARPVTTPVPQPSPSIEAP